MRHGAGCGRVAGAEPAGAVNSHQIGELLVGADGESLKVEAGRCQRFEKGGLLPSPTEISSAMTGQ